MKKQRILIIDDMKEVYEKIAELADGSYDLQYANSVADGIKEINKGNYDLVITDFEIGEENPFGGLEILSYAKSKELPVVGMSKGNHEREILDNGGKSFLFKKELYELLRGREKLSHFL